MTYILTPNGRRPIVSINESAEQVNDTEMNIDLDVEHFLDYVMENFPELTEKYIEENYEQVDELSRKTLGSYAYKADNQLGKVDATGPSHKAGIPSHYRGKNKELGKDPADKMRARKAGIKLAVKKLDR
jgi:hypothetical protein